MQDNNELLRVTLYRSVDNTTDWFEKFTITDEELVKLIMDVDFTNNRNGTSDDLNKSRVKPIAQAILHKLKGE